MSEAVVDTPEEEIDEFEAAFNEHAEAKSGPVEDPEPSPGEEPGEEPDIEKAGTGEGNEPPGGKPSEEDLYAGLTPEQMLARLKESEEENKNLTHRLKSDAGRVSAFQRKVTSLEREIQDIREGSTTGDMPTNLQIKDAMSGSDEEWASFAEDYPEVARAIDNRLERAGQATQESIESTLEPVRKSQAQAAENEKTAAMKAATDAVAETFPTWTEAVQTPEFAEWLDAQSPGVQMLAMSDETSDANSLISMYDTYLVSNGKPTLRATENAPGPGGEREAKSEIAAKRERQLEDGTTIKSQKAGISPDENPLDDFEAAFNYHANRKERQRQAG